MKRKPIKIAMTMRVLPAFLDSGERNAGTPLLIASIPVKAVQPVENARISRSTVNAVGLEYSFPDRNQDPTDQTENP
jgi:hypothetical protein